MKGNNNLMPNLSVHKKELLKRVLNKKISVTLAALNLQVSRKTIYKWLKSAQVAKNSGNGRVKADKKNLESQILKAVVANPDFGPKRIYVELKKREILLSAKSIWLILKRLNLQTVNLRRQYSYYFRHPKQARDINFPGHLRLIPESRKRMIEDVILGNIKVKDAVSKFKTSRKTFAKWKKRYLLAQKNDQNLLSALADRHPTGFNHQNGTAEKIVAEVLALVAIEPNLSSHKIAQKLGTLGNHGVQRILERNNLSHLDLRLRFAQEQPTALPAITPSPAEERPRMVLPTFTPQTAPAPPPLSLKSYFSSPRHLLAAISLSIITLGIFIFWGRMVFSYPAGQAIGLLFASIALVVGTFFFLYSLKYYLTIAIVLSFSQGKIGENEEEEKRKGLLSWILGLSAKAKERGKVGREGPVGLEPNLEHIKLDHQPMVCIQIPFYNEKNVAERALQAACNLDYPEFEVIIADDSTDQTPEIIRAYMQKYGQVQELKEDGYTLSFVKIREGVTLKHLHRTTRSGFKGAALRLALECTDPKVEFISIFDADFVPYPDTISLFLKYFKVQNNMSEDYTHSNVAAVQGYQWHVLNKSENWITRGVRSEYAGSYVIERAGTELYGGLKMISGSVYMIRRKPLEEAGWGTSITEDFELTLKLYERGYKVVYTPYIQAPAECVSTLKRLIRQRMRWAEGHSANIKQMVLRLLLSKKLTPAEKLETVYLSPYYLQALFFMVGTLSWLLSEAVFKARLPFWTSLWGWSLVLTNLISLPLVNIVGLFLEESEEKDYIGIFSFLALSYVVVPFQAYAAIKGFLEEKEGDWFRTPKTGRVTDIITRGKFMRLIAGIFQRKPALPFAQSVIPINLENQYLTLPSANNRFDNFKIRAKKARWIGRISLAVLLIITVTFYTFNYKVSEVYATNPSGTFAIDAALSTLVTASYARQLVDNSWPTAESAATRVTAAKNLGYFLYLPGATNTSTGTPSTSSTSGGGWIYETAFGSGGTIGTANGTWNFNLCTWDSDSDGKGGGYPRYLGWKVAVNTVTHAISSDTILFDTDNTTNYFTGTCSAVNLWTGPAADQVQQRACTLTQKNVSFTAFDATENYFYVEMWDNINDANDDTTDNEIFYDGNVNHGGTCNTTGARPRIVAPAVSIPEYSLVLIFVVPFIPIFIRWYRRLKYKSNIHKTTNIVGPPE